MEHRKDDVTGSNLFGGVDNYMTVFASSSENHNFPLLAEDSSSNALLPEEILEKNMDNSLESTINVTEDTAAVSVLEKDNSKSLELGHNQSTIMDSCSFQLRAEAIPCIPSDQQEEGLVELGVSIYDQIQFETEVMDQVDKALQVHAEAKRKANIEKDLQIVSDDIRAVKNRLNQIKKALCMAPKDESQLTNIAKRELVSIRKEQENKLKQLKKLEAKQRTLLVCSTGSVEEIGLLENNSDQDLDEETLCHLREVFAPKETDEEKLIRTGHMTPFGTVVDKPSPRKIIIPTNKLTEFDKFLLSEAETHQKKKAAKLCIKSSLSVTSKRSSLPLEGTKASCSKMLTDLSAAPKKKRKTYPKFKLGSKHAEGYSKTMNPRRKLIKNYISDSDISDFEVDEYDENDFAPGDDEYIPNEIHSDSSDCEYFENKGNSKLLKEKISGSKEPRCISSDFNSKAGKSFHKRLNKVIDDGCQSSYIKRMTNLKKNELLKRHKKIMESEDGIIDSDSESESYVEFDGDYKIPVTIWDKLYRYQQTGVRWLWELHQQNCGGIVGDEMGLGKTIQVIAFLIGLKYSKLLTIGDVFTGLGPIVLVCPATVMHQWVKEFHTWWPPFRVAILHESGSFTGKKSSLVKLINKSHGVIITSYAGVVQHQSILLEKEWHYIILDEGHKIRNPDAQATLAVKQFRTQHRIILSGSPVQNNLKELWSLFDFVFPGKLGTLPVFMQQFSVPIVLGGYANASQIQVQTAYKCATVLRDTIKPYLLRRMKSDVKMSINLPNKNEQVLFCKMTEEQIHLYKGYLDSKEINSILNSRLQIFVGLINLRKICNHPDLFDGGPKVFVNTDVANLSEDMHYGYHKRSGKMIVLEALLHLWFKQSHRVLLFTQSRQMMEILEIFIKKKNYSYMKMDGSTSISSRQPAIAKFNMDSSIFIFLLTTRVGGIGVNLTGADRVIIYDPDWNPSTDSQARERAWRIGQNKQVTIYRLLTAGTIEEKIYHRQIFKQFITNRVLKDPRQRRFFKSNDMHELFTYVEMGTEGTETSAIFAGTGSEVKPVGKSDKLSKLSKNSKKCYDLNQKEIDTSKLFSAAKIEKMKQLARRLSLELSKKATGSINNQCTSTELKKQTADISHCTVLPDTCSKQNSETVFLKNHSNNSQTLPLDNKDSKKKHSHKRKQVEIDGKKIDFIVKKGTYKSASEDDEKLNSKQDDYVLSKLFKKSGVHTALKHDVIVESSDPDYMIVEGEANKVAKEAINALRESRRMCARAEEGIPTWTGQHGGMKPRFGQKKKTLMNSACSTQSSPESPHPSSSPKSSSKSFGKKLTFDGKKESPKDAPSSQELLMAINQRKDVFGSDVHSGGSEDDSFETQTPPTNKSPTEYDDLLVEIRNFIAFRASTEGQARTKEIIEAFRDKLPIHQTSVFKALLSRICDFSRSSSGEGIWYLKGEFR